MTTRRQGADGQTELDTLREAGAANVIDVLDRRGIGGCYEGLTPVTPVTRFAGRVRLATLVPVEGEWSLANYGIGAVLDALKPGDVLLLEARGVPGTVVGDLAAYGASLAGAAGMVVLGQVRDAEDMVPSELAVFASGISLRSGVRGYRLQLLPEPIELGGRRLANGDVVVGACGGLAWFDGASLEVVVGAIAQNEAAEARVRTEFAARTRSFEETWKTHKGEPS